MKPLMGALAVALTALWAMPAGAAPILDNVAFANAGDTVNNPQNLQIGDTVYTDRLYTFTSIPASLQGLEWLQTANNAKSNGNTLNFDVLVNATLYLWIDDRENVAVEMPWVASDGWVPTPLAAILTNEFAFGNRSYSIYSRDVSGGSSISTGVQQDNSYYGLAAARQQSSVPEPTALLLIGAGLAGFGSARCWRNCA